MRFVILHYHIFKNAGSTIEDILDHSFGDRFGTLETPANEGVVQNSELLHFLDARPGVRAFSSHQIRYPIPEAPGYLFFDICFLRDPLDRLRSFYDYFRQRPNPADPMSAVANRTTLGEFVAEMIRDYSLFVRNNQVNLIACGGDSDEPDERDLELAIRRMKAASFLGVVDCFEQSVVAGADWLRPAFPGLDCARPAVNVSRGLSGTVEGRVADMRTACAPDVFEELMRMTALDRRLVDAARAEVFRRFELVRPRKVRTDVRRSPGLSHFLVDWGWQRHPLFDPDFYLDRNSDVREARVNPWVHYLRHGAAEDRKPHPLFEPRYYRANCGETLAAGQNPLAHFLEAGVAAANPHPLFDCDAYLNSHPDAEAAGMNPLVHYLSAGHEKRSAGIEICDVVVDPDAAEPQQVPFLRALSVDQIRAQSSR